MAAIRESRLIVSLLDRVSAPGRKVATSLRNLGNDMSRFSRGGVDMRTRLEATMARTEASINRARGGVADSIASYYALKAAIGAPVQAAREFDSAMADVRKVVDFPTPKAYQQFERDLIALSKRVPITVNGLAEIAAAAGQAGIAGDDLLPFVEMAAQVGTAFDITADQAGEGMAKIMTGLGMTREEAERLADAMNHLSNQQASKASELLDFTRRVGAQAKQYGFAAQEAVAFGSAMIASGAETEVAATSFRNMGRALTRGESATKRQSAAMQRLGLDSADVARRMQEDAVGTTVDVMERIAALPKDVQASVSSDLFGDEARALGPLLTNLDLVRDSIGMVAHEADYAGSAFREFEVRAKTFDNAMRIFGNRMTALKVVIGSALIPILTDLMDRIAPVIDRISEFVSAHPQLVGNVMASVGALVAFRGALAALRFVGLLGQSGALNLAHLGLVRIGGTAGRISGAARASMALQASLAAMQGATVTRWDRMGAALRGVGGATPGVRMAIPAVSGIVATVGAISAPAWLAIAVAVGAVGAAWKYWDQVKAIASGVGSAVREALAPAMEKLKPVLEPLSPLLERAGRAFSIIDGGIRDAAEAARRLTVGIFTREVLTQAEIDAIKQRAHDLTEGIIEKIKALPGKIRDQAEAMYDAGAQFMGRLVDGALEKLQKLIDRVQGAAASFRNAFSYGEGESQSRYGGPGAGAPGMQSVLDGKRAKGGRVSARSTYLVGEQGPEAFAPTKSGYIHPNGSGGGFSIGSITINPALSFPGATAADADRIAREVMRRLQDETGAVLRSAFADIGLE